MANKGQKFALGAILFILFIITGCYSPDSKDPTERYFAVAYLEDQTILAKLALEDEDRGVREAALKKLTDQPF